MATALQAVGVRGGQKIKFDFELAPYLIPFSLLSWFQKGKDELWAHMGSASSGGAIFRPKWP